MTYCSQLGPLSLCMFIFTCAGADLLVHVHMSVPAYGGERSSSGVIPQELPTLFSEAGSHCSELAD